MIDVRMPEIDGLECARRLRVQSPETRVILVTGLDDASLPEQAREAGAVALLVKGALHDQLKEAILAAAPEQQLAHYELSCRWCRSGGPRRRVGCGRGTRRPGRG